VSDRSVAAHYGPATILPWRFGPSGPVIPLGSGNRMVPWAVPSAYGKRSENWTAFVSYKMIAHLLADEGGSYERAGDHHRGYSDASATVADLVARDANEGDTRLLVTDFLCDGPGFDKYADLTTEYQVKGEFADYGLRIDRGLVAFIEVKRVATKLWTRHLRQVEMYTVNEGVEWIILTNGAVWQVYHITGPARCHRPGP
jgi:hypothetical protein